MPRGDDEADNSRISTSVIAASASVPGSLGNHPQPSSTRSDISQPMFLPEQTPSSPSTSSASSSRSTTAQAAHTTPPPVAPVYQDISFPQIPADHRLGLDYDMHLLEGDSLEDSERAARRWRAHGKRRQRDDIAPIAPRAGCFNLDIAQLSCQPTANQIVVQNHWFEFQWSSWNPLFNQVRDVHIYLFNGASGDQVGFWSRNKLQGSIQVNANDTFWGTAGPSIQPDRNQSFPFYFVVIPSTATVHNGETSEPTFTGVQTALPNSVLATLSTGSLASTASLASLESVSSASLSSKMSVRSTATSVLASSTSSPGTQPGGGGGSNFPGWAIALITILAFFLLLAILLGAYLVMRRIRKQREEEGRRNSMGSASPMMMDETKNPPLSPIDAEGPGSSANHGTIGMEKAALFGVGAGAGAATSSARGGSRDGLIAGGGVGDTSSMMSGSDTTGPGMLSGADAAIVADAFRQAMRKPDFSGSPVEEDESPDQRDEDEAAARDRELMNMELAKEGRDIRSVSSARDVRVQGSTP